MSNTRTVSFTVISDLPVKVFATKLAGSMMLKQLGVNKIVINGEFFYLDDIRKEKGWQ